MPTDFLPATVTRCSALWPCTSALGDRTRKNSAGSAKLLSSSKVTVRTRRSLSSRSSVGHGSAIACPAQPRSIVPSTTCLSLVPSAVSTIFILSLPLPPRLSSRTTSSMACWEVTPTSFRYLRIDILKRCSSMLGLLWLSAPCYDKAEVPIFAILETKSMPLPSGKRRAKAKKRRGGKMKAKRTVKRRSATAASLASPLYRKRVVRSAKTYSRKGRVRSRGDENEET